MRVPLMDLKAQYLTLRPAIDAAIADCIEHTAFVQGRRVEAFEKAFADFEGVAHVVGCSNGTDAIYLALKAMGIGPGDEVITAANSFIATSEAVTMTGARVVFVDVDPESSTIGPEQVRPRITPRTRALLPVHLYGRPADLLGLRTLADEHGLRLVADAAQAHGARLHGHKVASLVDAATYSFYPGKNLGAFGDAGAVATNDPVLAERMSMVRNHGRKEKYIHDMEGENKRLDEMQGAILAAKLPHLEAWTLRRRELAAAYTRRLDGVGDLCLPREREGEWAVYHLYVIETAARDALMHHLEACGIGCGVHYPLPLPLQPAYAHLGMTPTDIPVAAAKAGRILSLPMYPEMSDAQLEYVVAAVAGFFS